MENGKGNEILIGICHRKVGKSRKKIRLAAAGACCKCVGFTFPFIHPSIHPSFVIIVMPFMTSCLVEVEIIETGHGHGVARGMPGHVQNLLVKVDTVHIDGRRCQRRGSGGRGRSGGAVFLGSGGSGGAIDR